MDRFYNQLLSILNRSLNGWKDQGGTMKKQGWFLMGSTLAHFLLNYTLKGCNSIHIGVAGRLDALHQVMLTNGFRPKSDNEFVMPCGVSLVIQRFEQAPELIEEFAKDYDRIRLQFPANIGAMCDAYDENWTENTKRNEPYKYPENIFFDDERRKNGHEFIAKMYECGRKVGIADKMFLGFGNVLGYAICGDFLPKDDDIDMCILADDIPQEQRHQYLMECKNAGLTENRMHGPVMIEDKYSWFSIGPKSPFTEHGVKSCTWFWFSHGGLWWHSKSKDWIGRSGLDREHPTAKGIPLSVFNGELKKVSFGGVEVQIPQHVGRCLDYWYEGWVTRKKGASGIKSVLVMPSNDRKTWFIERK
jgi:hypothetical protein